MAFTDDRLADLRARYGDTAPQDEYLRDILMLLDMCEDLVRENEMLRSEARGVNDWSHWAED